MSERKTSRVNGRFSSRPSRCTGITSLLVVVSVLYVVAFLVDLYQPLLSSRPLEIPVRPKVDEGLVLPISSMSLMDALDEWVAPIRPPPRGLQVLSRWRAACLARPLLAV